MIVLLLLAQLVVTDGDSLRAPWGERYRIHGIDAPELAQECERDGRAYACGLEAKAALEALLEGKETVCESIEQDRYSRTVARCTADGLDVGEEMVRQGWALDYYRYSSYEYARAQQYAKDRRLGMWAGEFTEPWVWRREQRSASEAASDSAPGECLIKGNINSEGERIYHTPGSENYDQTRISSAKGERWFCTEVEARGAGWRPAQK